MAFIGPYFYDRVRETTTTTGTGQLTLLGASGANQAFSVVGNGNTCTFCIQGQTGTSWEVSAGTWSTGNLLSRDVCLASSNSGSFVNLSAGTYDVFLVFPAFHLANGAPGAPSGMRLTLTSGTPVTFSDVTAATTVYLTPNQNGMLSCWNGNAAGTQGCYQQFNLAQISVSVPATTNTPFDLYTNISGGTPVLSTVNWTNATTRATAIAQDAFGVTTKSGDQRYRFAGTGCTTGTSGQCEDSQANRFLMNWENRVPRVLVKADNTQHNYGSVTIREWNGGAGVNRFSFCIPDISYMVQLFLAGQLGNISGTGIAAYLTMSADSVTANNNNLLSGSTAGFIYCNAGALGFATTGSYAAHYDNVNGGIGLHYISVNEQVVATTGNATYYQYNMQGIILG